MKIITRTLLPTLLAIGVGVPLTLSARAVEPDQVNARARDEMKAFAAKARAGETLFGQKKWAEAAQALSEGNALFLRGLQRDRFADQLGFEIAPGAWPTLRFYGYGMGQNAVLRPDVTGKISTSYHDLNRAVNEMWSDAAILSGASQVPGDASRDDPGLISMTSEVMDSVIRATYGPPSNFKMPVQDDEWSKVLLWSRRSKLLLEYALVKYPEWKTQKMPWSGKSRGNNYDISGDDALAEMNAFIKEAEPEVAKLVSDFKSAEPRGFSAMQQGDIQILNKVLAGVKRDGWMDWGFFTDFYISKDYVADRRKVYQKVWSEDGKTLPAGVVKPLETQVAAILGAANQNASRFSFPAGKTHNAAIEAAAKSTIKHFFPAAKILKTALSTGGWSIVRDEAQIPKFRQRAVMVLIKQPNQPHAWLINGVYVQDYSGGGTYNSSGTFSPPYLQARLQKAS